MRKIILASAVTVVLLVILVFTLILMNEPNDEERIIEIEWLNYKNKYNKFYNSSAEDERRKLMYINSKYLITEHNKLYDKGLVTFALGINHFADLTDKEYVGAFTDDYDDANEEDSGEHNIVVTYKNVTNLQVQEAQNNSIEYKFLDKIDLPLEVDWIKYGYKNPILDQGYCGSCYVFSSLAAIEANYYIKYKTLLQLSHQEILDCSLEYGSFGCNGGFTNDVYFYTMLYGVGLADQNPYVGKETYKCKKTNPRIFVKKKIFKTDINESILKEVVALYGPVTSSINAGLYTFKFYKSGLYYDPKCTRDSLQHGVTTVGYGITENGKDYWLIRNSFGQDWGVNGYMYIAKNRDNHCGLATEFFLPQF